MIIELLYNERTETRKPPINILPDDEVCFEHEYCRKITASFLKTSKNVCLTKDGLIFKFYRILFKPIHFHKGFGTNTYRYIISTLLKSKFKKLKHGNYIAAFQGCESGYFHFIADICTRLIEVKKYSDTHTLILPSYFQSGFQFELIESFGFSNIIYFSINEYLKIKTITYPTFIAPTGNFNSENIQKLRLHFINYFKISNSLSAHRIYISRAKAERRHVLNEDELIPILNKYNFKVLFFEDMNLREQINTMHNTKFLIGIVGANLTNCMFMNEGSYLFELRKNGDTLNNLYFSLASACNIKFCYQMCNSQEISKIGDTFDLIVDVAEFEKNIKFMLNHSKN